LVLFLCCSYAAAQSPSDFAYAVPLQTDGAEPLYELEIPTSVYRGITRRDFGDVRMFNAAGETVPFALEPSPVRRTEKTPPRGVRYFPLYGEQSSDLEGLRLRVEKAGGGTVVSVDSRQAVPAARRKLIAYLIDTSNLEQPYEALELDWRQDDSSFAANVRLEASDDLKAWSVVLGQAPLVRVDAGGQRLEQRVLEFAPHRSKYLRLSWPQSAQPIELRSAALRTGDIVHEPERSWLRITAQDAGKIGEYWFDLQGQFPVDRVRLELPQQNTVARVAFLSRPDPKQPWRAVTNAVVYRLARQGGDVVSPDLAVLSGTDRYWLLRVDQTGGGLGNGTPKLSVGWVPQKLVFAARGNAPFQLAYGSAVARPATYSIETLVPEWRSEVRPQLATARALPEQLLGGEAALRPKRDYKIWALWAALAGGVLLLAWMAWRLARQMQPPAPEREPESPPAP